MLDIEQIRETLKKEDLKILKNLGQNFLIDENVLSQIVSSAKLSPSDTVLEIGPGMGTLTFALSEKCKKVFAVEKDKKLSNLLIKEVEKGGDKKANVKIFCEDILKMNIPAFLKRSGTKKYKLVANIPYYITSPIIRLFLETEIQPEVMVLLIQKEVAERICAKKGEMSVLALSVLLYGHPEIIKVVKKESFYPAPKVDSAILKISSIGRKFSQEEYASIFRIIKVGFSAKRKKLVNNLSVGFLLDKEKIEQIFEDNNININARPQDLGLEDWLSLANRGLFQK